MKRYILDGMKIELSGRDITDGLTYVLNMFKRRTNSRHLRVNRKRWRTEKEVGDDPVKKKK